MIRSPAIVRAVAALALVAPFSAALAVPSVQQRIENITLYGASPTTAQNQLSGNRLARGGNWLVLGAADDVLRFYERVGETWVWRQNLAVPAPGIGALAMNDHVVVIGQPTASVGGSALVAWRDGATWTLGAPLTSGQIAAGDQFGASVAVDPVGDTVVVGAQFSDTVQGDGGAAYVFTRNGNAWSVAQRLTPTAADAGGAGDRFGRTVATAAGRIAISAPLGGGGTQGYVRVFRFDGTSWVSTTDIAPVRGFGIWGDTLALSDDALIIGDTGLFDFAFGTMPGQAAVFARSGEGWNLQADYYQIDEDHPGLKIGATVALAGDRAVAGSGDGSRMVTFRRTAGTWSVEHVINSVALGLGDVGLTSGLAVSADQIIAGAPRYDQQELTDVGAAFVLAEVADVSYADIDVRDAAGTTPVATSTTLEIVDLPGGGPTTLALTLHNTGAAPLTALAIGGLAAPLQATLSSTVVTPGGTPSALTIACDLASAGASTLQTLRIASNDPDEPFVDYHVRCVSPDAGDVVVTIDDGTTVLPEGGAARYTITVRNSGLPLTDVRIAAPLAATLGFGSWTCSVVRDGACDDGNGTGGIDATVDLGTDAEIVFTLDATVTGSNGEFVAQQVTATVPSGQADANLGNNQATDTDAIGANAVFADGFED